MKVITSDFSTCEILKEYFAGSIGGKKNKVKVTVSMVYKAKGEKYAKAFYQDLLATSGLEHKR